MDIMYIYMIIGDIISCIWIFVLQKKNISKMQFPHDTYNKNLSSSTLL